MANELTISASLKFVKGQKTTSVSKSGIGVDVAGGNYISRTQTIGTTAEALNLGEMSNAGYIFIRNLDATNFVKIRIGNTGADVVKIRPGKIAMFELAANTPYAIADTADVDIEYTLIEA